MNNPPAFPCGEYTSTGMFLRDYIAAQALSGLINYSPEPSEHEAIAKLCYSLADAMMKAREA
jgi:hypothetical protein